MVDPKKQAEVDQGLTMIVEYFPGLWFRLYKKLVGEGFSEEQAFRLLTTYVHGAAGGKFTT